MVAAAAAFCVHSVAWVNRLRLHSRFTVKPRRVVRSHCGYTRTLLLTSLHLGDQLMSIRLPAHAN